MSLIPALLTNPRCPPALVEAVADRTVPGRTDLRILALLVAHPNLREGHPVRARARTPAAALERLAANADLSPADVTRAVALAGGRTQGTGMTVKVARQVARHPASPPALAIEALHVMLRPHQIRARDRGWLLTAAVRHPGALADLAGAARDPHLRAELVRYAAMTHPGGLLAARGEEVAARAHATGTAPAWLEALRDAPVAEVVTGATGSLRPGWILGAIMRSGAITAELRTTAVRTLLATAAPHADRAHWLAASLQETLPRAELMALVATAEHAWEVAHTPLRDDLDGCDLATLWQGALALQFTSRSHLPQARLAHFGVKLGLHEAVGADLLARVRQVVLDFGCSAAADAVRWYSTTTALAALDAAAHGGPVAAGRTVPVPTMRAGHHGYMAAAGTYRRAVAAAIADRGDMLSDPAAARAFLALAPSFPGTVGELLDTVEGVCACEVPDRPLLPGQGREVLGAGGDELGDLLSRDGAPRPDVDTDVDHPAALTPHLVDVPVNEPLAAIQGAVGGVALELSGVPAVGEVGKQGAVPGEGEGFGVVDDLGEAGVQVALARLEGAFALPGPAAVVVARDQHLAPVERTDRLE